MHHAAELLRVVFFHDAHRVCGSFPRMDDHRKIHLRGELQLAREPVLLYLPVGLRPVVVKADLAHGERFFVTELFADLFENLIRHVRAVFGMDPERTVDVRVAVRQGEALVDALYGRRDVHHAADPCGGKAGEQFVAVCIKSFIIVVRVRVKDHRVLFPIKTLVIYLLGARGGWRMAAAGGDCGRCRWTASSAPISCLRLPSEIFLKNYCILKTLPL